MWTPVLQDKMQDPGAAAVVWRRLSVAFSLADPRSARPASSDNWSPGEHGSFARYMGHAEDLAASSLLSANDSITVRIGDEDGEVTVEETTSAKDITVGFMTMFRQMYAKDEPASFKTVHGLLMRELKQDNAHKAVLVAWSKAEAQLRMYSLEHLVLQGLARRELIPIAAAEENPAHPDFNKPPQELLSMYFYGDMIHWGNKRDLLLASKQDSFTGAKERLDAVQAAIDLAQLYIGFSAVVGAITGYRSEA